MLSRKMNRKNGRKGSRSASRKNMSRKNGRKSMNRKGSRKSMSRKGSRKSMSRKNGRKGRKCYGGAYNPMELSLRQGQQFDEQHVNQHGGANSLYGAPVGDQGLLPAELRDMARITPLDGNIREASVMRDPDQNGGLNGPPTMIGGRRKGMSRKAMSRKASRKGRKAMSRKAMSRKAMSRKGRKASQRGGNYRVMGSPYNAPSMLLDDKSMSAGSGTQNGGRRKGRKQRGGAHMWGSPIDQPTMLLTEAEAREAGTGDFSNPLLKH